MNLAVYNFSAKVFDRIIGMSFFDKCIALSMLLLILCSLFSVLRIIPLAEYLANTAYFVLLIAVGIKSWKAIVYREKNQG